jgi:hypothetical protein
MSVITNPYVKSKQKQPPQYARICPVCETSFVTKYQKKMCCTKYCTDIKWRREHPESVRIITAAAVRRQDQMDRPATECNCGDYRNCMSCRNAERRRAFKAGDVPAYRRTALAAALTANGTGD